MQKLSARLKMIADNIEDGAAVADIGTDHGYLPVYLYETGKCPYVVMTDISEDSLAKAIRLGEEYLTEEASKPGLCARAGNGLDVIREKEVDTVVIAGMGGLLISEIMAKDPEKSHGFKRFILQPRTAVPELRMFLKASGFGIAKEELVREGRYICEIIIAEPASEKTSENDEDGLYGKSEEAQFVIPLYYADMENKLADEYIEKKIAKYKEILQGMRMGKSFDEKSPEALQIKDVIAYAEDLKEKRKQRQQKRKNEI